MELFDNSCVNEKSFVNVGNDNSLLKIGASSMIGAFISYGF